MKLRRGEASGGTRWQRLLVWAIPATTLGIAAVAAGFLVHLVLPLSEPWATYHAIPVAAMRRTSMFGLATLSLGVAALVHVRRSRQFRRLSISACHLIAIVVGGAALVVGALLYLYLVVLSDEVARDLPGRLNRLRMPAHSSPGSGPIQRRAGTSEILVDPPDQGELDPPYQAEPPTGR
jgi:hypothetical protein